MGRFKDILIFLKENDIDTEYYLNDEARELYNIDKLDLREIEKAPVEIYASYLDLPKLIKEEDV